jgi:hypothetical protein
LLPNKGRFSAILGAVIGFIYVLLSLLKFDFQPEE